MLKKLRDYLVAGIVVVVPLFFTFFVLWWSFRAIHNLIDPVIKLFFDKSIPGLSLLILFGVLLAIGGFTRATIGKKLVSIVDTYIDKIPILRELYGAAKQLTSAIFVRDEEFKNVVLLEYPRQGVHSLGLITGAEIEEVQEKTDKDVISVYVPTSPNPTSGMMVFVSRDQITSIDMEVDEALRLIISGGFTSPLEGKQKKPNSIKNDK
ncbi:MAG: putative membrane protein [Candidatus Methanohalarchaeum thermophilum]|uniref:Membrane protein n=1 Tax=Methanohalarchaeum thermophilum TaxID=1903181 RepID=A0A1Q6DXL3_METT1|nr:MAG: putative membrane protein [Candidatus Methanohalarchaeum thermophilum]